MDQYATQQVPMDQYVTQQTRPDAPKRAARWTPDAKDIGPEDPDWEVFGDRVVRIYANSLRPRGVDPLIWNSGGDANKNRILAEVTAKERARKSAEKKAAQLASEIKEAGERKPPLPEARPSPSPRIAPRVKIR